MFKFLIVAFLLCRLASADNNEITCSGPVDGPNHWIDMASNCSMAVRRQIQMEVDASYIYLSMAAYFSRDEVNLPGFAKMFFEHASEERSHAYALIEYLLMRGPQGSDQKFTDGLISTPDMKTRTWANGLEALKDALKKETEVTQSIRRVIDTCEKAGNRNDYHLNDYLTGEFLEEQYKGMRELAGKIATLSKMMTKSEPLGMFLFEKELLA